jgi:hypothetical protein
MKRPRPSSSRPTKNQARSKVEYWREWVAEDPPHAAAPVDPGADLPGSIYAVPDKFWGFEVVGRDHHPGVCAACQVESRRATLLKGTDLATARSHRATFFVVHPTPRNGLSKDTAFELVPRAFRMNRVVLLHSERRMGALDAEDLARLQEELVRLFAHEEQTGERAAPAGPAL